MKSVAATATLALLTSEANALSLNSQAEL